MDVINIYKSRRKGIRNVAYAGLLALPLIAILIYSVGLTGEPFKAKGTVFSAAFLIFILYYFTSTLINLNSTVPLIELQRDGMITRVNRMGKAAGLLLWDDLVGFEHQKISGDDYVRLKFKNAEVYVNNICTKMNKSIFRNAFDENTNTIYILASVSDADYSHEEFCNHISIRGSL